MQIVTVMVDWNINQIQSFHIKPAFIFKNICGLSTEEIAHIYCS